MKIVYIFLGYLVNFLNSKCDELIKPPLVTCYSYIQKCSILEGDQEDYQELQHIDTQIIKKSIQIPYKDEPILIRIINSVNENKIQDKMMCFLFLNIEYYITCINFDLIFYEEQTNFNELIRIDTKIQANEHCDEIFTNEDGSLSLFCIGKFTFKQYSLYLQKNVTLIMEHDFTDQIQDGCKKKLLKWKENLYFIVFYQCSKFKIMLIKNNQVKTIFDDQKKYQDIQLSNFSFIDDVQFCEPNDLTFGLFLIENDFYLQIYLAYFENSTPSYLLLQHTNRIQKIVIQPRCNIIILVNKLEISNSLTTNPQQTSEIILNQQYSNNNIHFHSNLLFLQNQFELNVQINTRINQTYEIWNTSLHFFDFNNLFCQFDQTKKVIQFYQYYPLSAYIKPKLKYLYIIEKINLFRRNATIKCFRISNENNNQKEISKFIEFITFHNNCQNKSYMLWNSKNSNYLKNDKYNLQTREGNIKISIRKYYDYQNNCLQRLYKFHAQGKFELRDIKYDYICFQNESFFYIYDCKENKFSVSVNKDQYNVLESKGGYYFFNKNNNQIIRGVKISPQQLQLFNLKFDEVITSVKEITQTIFLQTNNSYLPLIIIMNQQNNLWKNYLSKNLYQPEPILFYFEFGNSKFIQYVKILAFQNKEIFRCYQFPESVIIFMEALVYSYDYYSIIAIQNQTKSLILTFFNEYELHQIVNYTFQDYQFSYPFKYSIYFQNLAILIEQNNQLNIAIFQYTLSTLQLIEIIATDDSFFKLYRNNLLFSFNKVWRQQFLNQIEVQLETEWPYQKTLASDLSISLNEDSGIELKIQIYNQCFQLYSLINSSIIPIQKNLNQKLNISDIFYGPITNLTLLKNSNIILNGPFQLQKELQYCNQINSKFCIQIYNYETELKQLIFSVIVFENQNIEVIKTKQYNPFFYVTWIKQQYYLCIQQFKDNLIIQLIECSVEQDNNCNLITNLNENFKINQINVVDTIRTGNLIKLKSNDNQAFIFIEGINFNLQILPDIIVDILYIEQSNDQYLILQKNMRNSNDLELTIYSINLHQKLLIYSLTITNALQIELKKNGNYYNQQYTIRLVSCKYSGELIKIKLFIMYQHFSQFLQLNLDQKKNYIQFEFQKQIRNVITIKSFQDQDFIIEYIDDNILVLQQTTDNMYQFYDLRENRKFYDYFHKSIFFMEIIRLNTTHFIFYNNSLIYLGQIGYELILQNWDENEQNFELFAQNEISNQLIQLQLHIITKNQQFTKSILFIFFIFILIQIRQKKSRKRQKNSLQ
ncbi:unnamed protein product [Paramecium primaurelia]|uniref:Transmembrane protein n=1 Tax=Paramecium primaurelia TaxID=5886 RepID=A0A8S1QDH5_PARPR|nr:unnamed protein product [Paramecium primaurelia]